MPTSAPARPEVAAAFETQISWCSRLGSPFTAALLRHALDDIRAGGPVAALLGSWPGDPKADALALRLAGALHALVLTERDADLAGHYPPHAPGPGFRDSILAAVQRHEGFIRDWLESPPQTNEVGRSGVLLGGFLEVARSFGKPLRLLEIGASAGLNMAWDRFRYRLGDAEWGDPGSPVRLAPDWTGPLPPLDTPITVASRAGCDQRPIRLEEEGERLRLRAYVWADMQARAKALDGAIELARRLDVRVQREDAADWVERRLAEPATDAVAVLYHTVVWQYLPTETQARIRACLDRYGAGAPLAWLRLEAAPPDRFELTLTSWRDGIAHERIVADAHPHGASVAWRA